MGVVAGTGVLMQVAAENKDLSANVGGAGESDVAPEDQDISAHETIKKSVSREHPHAAQGMAVHFGGAEKASGTLRRFPGGYQDVPAKMTNFRWRLPNCG
jgi:tetrahydromethanopterin S-methyltransferase subunit E